MQKENTALKTENETLSKANQALAGVEKDNTALKDKIEILTATNGRLERENDALSKDNQKLLSEIDALTSELEVAGDVNTDLKNELAKAGLTKEALPQIKIGKKTYELTSPFTWAGQLVTHEVLADNTKLATSLVAEGVGNLREVA